MTGEFMNMELLQLLAQGYTLVTPTSRLARYLQYRFAAVKIREGKLTWETPDIIPWSAWLQRTRDELAVEHDSGLLLLSSQQQQLVWQEIIKKSEYAGLLLQTANTARQAIQAWQLCQQWEIDAALPHVNKNEDAHAFRQWAAAYRQRCKTAGWLDEAMLPAWLMTIRTSVFNNKKIVLAGFDEITPQQRSLLGQLGKAGCMVQEYQLPKRNTAAVAQTFADTGNEIRAAALWARQLLEADASHNIGIVVNNLQALHHRIRNSFDDVFLPGAILTGADTRPRPYSITSGSPLVRYPVIDTAMIILGLGNPAVLTGDLSSLLRSPFIKDAGKESQQRARLDARLAQYGEYKISLNTLYDLMGNGAVNPRDVPAGFMQACDGYRKIFPSSDRKQPASEWAKLFAGLLKIFGWPGERTLDSAEYQTVAEWQNLLNQLAALDLVMRAMTYREALAQVRQLAMNTRFQPETQEVPVQILGMNAAAAMQFDHIWIMGLHEEVWPPKADPNPFIPLRLQRAAGIPDASAEGRFAQAANLFQRLVDSSPDVMISCPENENERPLRPSPMIKPYLRPESVQFNRDAYHFPRQIFSAGKSGLIEDSRAPVIPAGVAASGGTALFRDQAACPFRAFARHRLYAEGLKSRDIGLDAMDRGSMIHDVMEKLWIRLGSHANLTNSAEAELDTLIHEAVSNTVNQYRRKYPLTFTGRFTQLETGRLKALIHDYLKLERERRPFTVSETERWHSLVFNNIEIKTRIDRIDQLADGRFVIMDYKTGDRNTTPAAWMGDRPDDPQLPLYAVVCEGEIAAIVFTRLKRGDIAYTGLAREEGLLPEVPTLENIRGMKEVVNDWDDLLARWREILNQLATAFREGDARVDPKNGASTCNYCDLHALCRIYEQNSGVSGQEAEYE